MVVDVCFVVVVAVYVCACVNGRNVPKKTVGDDDADGSFSV